MPSDLAFDVANRVHRMLMTISGGRIGWSISKMPVLELTTTGRRTGERRSTLLTAPWQDGATLAVVASAGGNDRHPAWFLNLRDDPAVTVRTEDGTKAMTARVLSGDERSAIWSQITDRYDNYAGYQSKADREIPVVLLEPTD